MHFKHYIYALIHLVQADANLDFRQQSPALMGLWGSSMSSDSVVIDTGSVVLLITIRYVGTLRERALRSADVYTIGHTELIMEPRVYTESIKNQGNLTIWTIKYETSWQR